MTGLKDEIVEKPTEIYFVCLDPENSRSSGQSTSDCDKESQPLIHFPKFSQFTN
jgi:hypothetical protein